MTVHNYLDQLTPLFPTTVLRRRIPGMEETNRQLAALIAELEATGPNATAGTSTSGGYQTPDGLLSHNHPKAGHPALVTLKGHITKAIKDYSSVLIRQECASVPARADFVMWGWAVSLKDGNWQDQHVHSGAHVSGVYYIAAPLETLADGQRAGKISFHDPRPRANMNQLPSQFTAHREAPVPGDMVLFPSWLEHSVSPFRGGGTRICIAFDAKLQFS